MNLVGKIFVVLIFVMSLVFMAFAVSVYATHRNWHDLVTNPEATSAKPLGLKPQLDQKKNENQQLTQERDQLKNSWDAEKKARLQAVAKVETENEELKNQRKADQMKLDALTKDLRAAVQAMQALEDAEAGLRKDTLALREQITKNQQERDAAFKTSVETTDVFNQTKMLLDSVLKRNKQLADDTANLKAVLRKFNLKEDPAAYAGMAYKVEGIVLATRAGGMIEISIGQDDGLLKGHKLEVYRIGEGVSKYLGQVEVIEVAPEKAVCKTVPGMQKATIQVNDRVASKLE